MGVKVVARDKSGKMRKNRIQKTNFAKRALKAILRRQIIKKSRSLQGKGGFVARVPSCLVKSPRCPGDLTHSWGRTKKVG